VRYHARDIADRIVAAASGIASIAFAARQSSRLDRAGKEVDWWARTGIEPTGIARKLWTETHPLQAMASLPGEDNVVREERRSSGLKGY
jgi:hypothetical protein